MSSGRTGEDLNFVWRYEKLMSEANTRIRKFGNDGSQVVPHDKSTVIATLGKSGRETLPENSQYSEPAYRA
ncbi:hypothetical protein GCM10010520_32900 [Rhizobium viscosum]